MAARAVLIAVFAAIAGASCATAEEIPAGIDMGDGIDPSVEAGIGGSVGDGSGGRSGTANGGSSSTAAGGAVSTGGSSGGGGRGGAAGRGGGRSTDDAGLTTGGAPSGAGGEEPVDGGPACPKGEKICRSDGMCWPIAPSKGCDLDDGCTPCPAPPANGFSMCSNQACAFDCLSGFRKNAQGTGCERGNATGGATGAGGMTGNGGRNTGGRSTGGSGGGNTGGSAGSGNQCNRDNCPDCSNILERPCCHDDGTCGCGLLGIGLLCGN